MPPETSRDGGHGLAIIVYTGTYDKVHYALAMASAAAAVGRPVQLFFTMTAIQANAARAKWMANDRVTRLHRCHAAADILDPPCILVAHDVRQKCVLWVHDVPPNSFNNMKIRPAKPGSAYLDDDLIWRIHRRSCNLF